jgi:hypothetical protein
MGKTLKKMAAVALSLIMTMSMMPLNVIGAYNMPLPSGEIIGFAALADDVAVQVVPFGTADRELNLPPTVDAVVRPVGAEEETPPPFVIVPERTTPAALAATPTDMNGEGETEGTYYYEGTGAEQYPGIPYTPGYLPTPPQIMTLPVAVTWQASVG